MKTLGKVLFLTMCCILFVTGHPSIQLTVTSRGRFSGSRPEVYTKLDSHDSTQGKFNIPEEVIERLLPYEAEEAIVTRERMDVSKWGKDLPKIKTDFQTKKHKKSKSNNEARKRKRKEKRKHSKAKSEQDKRGRKRKDLKKKKRKHKRKSVN